MPLCASVSGMTLVCIRLQVTKNQRLDPKIRYFDFFYRVFTTEDGPECRHRGQPL